MTIDNYPTDDDYCGVEPKRANLSFTDWFVQEYDVDQHPDAELDSNQLRHTGSEFSVSETTFYANGKDGHGNPLPQETQEKFERLWRYQCGCDGQTYGGEAVSSAHKIDTRARDKRLRAEAVCMQMGLPLPLREKVATFVATTKMQAYSAHYRGVDGAIIGEIAYQVAESVEEALTHPIIRSDVIQSIAEGLPSHEDGTEWEHRPIDVGNVIAYQFRRHDE